jgi:hypothetical protein
LPDDLFSNQKSQFGYILERLGMDNVGIFYEHLEYFTAIWYSLWSFGIFFRCGMFGPSKIWQPWLADSEFLLVNASRIVNAFEAA